MRTRGHQIGKILGAALIVAASFLISLKTMDALWPRRVITIRPMPTETAPLPAASRLSTVIAPVSVALTAIRDRMDQTAPRDLAGRRDGPVGNLLGKADIGWTVARGPFSVAGRSDGLAISTLVSGTLKATGQIAARAGNVTGSISSLFDSNSGRDVGAFTGRALDQRADVRGTVTVTARPTLSSAWRLDPNLSAQVTVGEGALSIVGMKVSVAKEIRPLLDRAVQDQVAALQARLRDDPFVEAAARREWAKMCRSISLKGLGNDAPDLWLETRPIRAFAAQPRVEAGAVVLTLGIEAQTRIGPAESWPSCPFPPELELLPPLQQSRVALAVPIDMPFSEANRLLGERLRGHEFPEDGRGPVAVTVHTAEVSPSGDRMLISLDVTAREQKSLFGFNARAMVHVWGRPVLDRARQVLRLADVEVDVQSGAAFGLLGAAARGVVPYLQQALADNAVIDLKPLAANARASIEKALADLRRSGQGSTVEATISDLRLTDVAFDASTLRVIAEANGVAKVVVNSLAP